MSWFLLTFIRFLLIGIEAIGFVALSVLASTVCSTLLLIKWIVLSSLRLIVKAWKVLRSAKPRTWIQISTITKNETDWIVIKVFQFSILLGAKQNVDKCDREPVEQNH